MTTARDNLIASRADTNDAHPGIRVCSPGEYTPQNVPWTLYGVYYALRESLPVNGHRQWGTALRWCGACVNHPKRSAMAAQFAYRRRAARRLSLVPRVPAEAYETNRLRLNR
ncbi:unnamed protein product, partial [Iphiclides podalirius]